MRYEGYELLYDSRYLAWLRHHHPESVHTLDNDVPSIVDASAHVPLSHPHEPVCDNLTSTTQSQSLQIASSTKPVNTTAVLGSSLPSSLMTPSSDICLPTSSMTLLPGSSLRSPFLSDILCWQQSPLLLFDALFR